MALSADEKSKVQGLALDLATASTQDPASINPNQLIAILLAALQVLLPYLTPAHVASISSAVNKP